jgi:hypothetical protein
MIISEDVAQCSSEAEMNSNVCYDVGFPKVLWDYKE